MAKTIEIRCYDPATGGTMVDRIELHEPDSTEHVMANVHTVLRVGAMWSDIGKLLIPIAFRLLCRIAFGE